MAATLLRQRLQHFPHAAFAALLAMARREAAVAQDHHALARIRPRFEPQHGVIRGAADQQGIDLLHQCRVTGGLGRVGRQFGQPGQVAVFSRDAAIEADAEKNADKRFLHGCSLI
ncbi:hypothetical protein D3C72_1572780 [compost metagenome]